VITVQEHVKHYHLFSSQLSQLQWDAIRLSKCFSRSPEKEIIIFCWQYIQLSWTVVHTKQMLQVKGRL